jgi:hypothetical protein
MLKVFFSHFRRGEQHEVAEEVGKDVKNRIFKLRKALKVF